MDFLDLVVNSVPDGHDGMQRLQKMSIYRGGSSSCQSLSTHVFLLVWDWTFPYFSHSGESDAEKVFDVDDRQSTAHEYLTYPSSQLHFPMGELVIVHVELLGCNRQLFQVQELHVPIY